MKPVRRLDEERRQLREERSIIDHLVQSFPVNAPGHQEGHQATEPFRPAPGETRTAQPLYEQLRRQWRAANGGLAEF